MCDFYSIPHKLGFVLLSNKLLFLHIFNYQNGICRFMDVMHIITKVWSGIFMMYASLLLILSITIGLDNFTILSAFLYFVYVFVLQLMGYSGLVIVYFSIKRIKKNQAIIVANMLCTAGFIVSLVWPF